MTFEKLISICNPLRVYGEAPSLLGKLRQDSRLVEKDDLFIAIRGSESDGHDFLSDVAVRGASVIICEEPAPLAGSAMEIPAEGGPAILVVPSTRAVIGPLAQAFQGDPADRLTCVGVTGTNGKTTVTTLVWQILRAVGIPAGLLGTVVRRIGDREEMSRLTTPGPIELAEEMKRMVDAGCRAVVMEVSSHALDQQRTGGIRWDVAAFTNLSHDHLDYHGDMESYALAKQKLFDELKPDGRAVINGDDPWGRKLAASMRNVHGKTEPLLFSFDAEEVPVRCNLTRSDPAGLQFTLEIDGTLVEIESPLVGRFNAWNVAQAFLICLSMGCDPDLIAEALKEATGAPGRMEKVDGPEGSPVVIVDYAHTPDALEKAASTLREIKKREEELVVVFGCGGDRDRGKRPGMAQAASRHADRVIVTSDNPRSEDPESIIREIERGFPAGSVWDAIPSREEAIRRAILEAGTGTLVLIAGKGHETWQEIGGKRIPFDDRKVARQALRDRVEGRGKSPAGGRETGGKNGDSQSGEVA